MKTLISLIILINVGFLLGQTTMAVDYSRTEVSGPIDFNTVYHKLTGEKISEKQFRKIVQENPNFYMEEEYDREGFISKYIYDPNVKSNFRKYSFSDRPQVGTVFPEFLFTTMDGRKLGSSQLFGKYIIILFIGHSDHGLPGFDMYNMPNVMELNERIQKFKYKENIVSFIVFSDDTKLVNKKFTLKDHNFNLVANGDNFQKKYKLNRTPVTLILDKEFKVLDWYNYSEDIELETILK